MCTSSIKNRLKTTTKTKRRLPLAVNAAECHHQVCIVFCCALAISIVAAGQQQDSLLLADAGLTRANSRSPLGGQLPLSTVDWPRIRLGLWRALSESARPSPWSRLGGSRPSVAPPSREPQRPASPLMRALGQLRNRIGARNTIRVHNAFRDFAWRLLSSFSMPTPVIYELRRQNFYPPDEDAANDNYYNRNTTRTIRSRRQDADDDEPET